MASQLLDDPWKVLLPDPEIRRAAPETTVMEIPVGPTCFADADHPPRLVAVKLSSAFASAVAADPGHVPGDGWIHHNSTAS
jgi:hypothetical protein